MPGGVKTEVRTYQMYINGEWVDSQSSKTFPVYDPAAEEVIAQVPDANADDVNRAVAAAKAAFEDGPWSQTTAQERGRVLFRLAEKVRQNSAMLAELEARNGGKPIVEAEFDMADVATCFEYYGGLATKILGYVNPVPDNAMSLTLKEPIGVAGQIIPWNFPLLMAAWKLAPALAAGNTAVLKPAETTPLTTPTVTLGSVFASTKPYGFPIAMTHSPTMSDDEFPSVATGSPFASTLSTARSLTSSRPTSFAGYVVPSRSATEMRVAPRTTCAFVTMTPSARMMNPDPSPATGRCPE